MNFFIIENTKCLLDVNEDGSKEFFRKIEDFSSEHALAEEFGDSSV